MDTNHNKEDKKPNGAEKKRGPGRPRLEDNPLRAWWREQKRKQKEKRRTEGRGAEE